MGELITQGEISMSTGDKDSELSVLKYSSFKCFRCLFQITQCKCSQVDADC